MARTLCPECKATLPFETKNCLKCGHVLTQEEHEAGAKKYREDRVNFRIGLFVAVIAALGYFFWPSSDDTSATSSAPAELRTNEPPAAAAVARDCSNLRGRAQYYNSEAVPNYVGCRGYLAGSFSIDDDEDMQHPAWIVSADDGQTKLLHKTEVVVLEEQYERAVSRGSFITGTLQVRLPTGETHSISARSFETIAYWNLPPEKAVEHGPFIAVYTGKGFPRQIVWGKKLKLRRGLVI